jgi:hypothetical protein
MELNIDSSKEKLQRAVHESVKIWIKNNPNCESDYISLSKNPDLWSDKDFDKCSEIIGASKASIKRLYCKNGGERHSHFQERTLNIFLDFCKE